MSGRTRNLRIAQIMAYSKNHILFAMFTEPALQHEFNKVATHRTIPTGAVIMQSGDPITNIPIVEKGSLRILAQDQEGHERYLYHIMPGESCAMSLIFSTFKSASSVRAVVEEEAELLMVPAHYMEKWMVHPEWRRFVYETQAQRLVELLETIEVVAFHKLDDQIWDYLVKRVQATGKHVLKLKQQDIANELNSPREVITRLLHRLERKGRVTLSRGSIEMHLSSSWTPPLKERLKGAL